MVLGPLCMLEHLPKVAHQPQSTLCTTSCVTPHLSECWLVFAGLFGVFFTPHRIGLAGVSPSQPTLAADQPRVTAPRQAESIQANACTYASRAKSSNLFDCLE